MRTTVGVSAAALLVASGCYFGGSDWGSSGSTSRAPVPDGRSGGTWDEPAYTEEALTVLDAHFAGSLGPVRDFSEEPYRVTAFRAGYEDVIRVDATDSSSGQWVMSELHVTGGLDDPAFAEGEVLSFTDGGSVPASAVFVSAIGCSGPSEGDFAYDETSQGVEAEVLSGDLPGQRRFVLHMTFADGSSADLSLEVQLPGSGPAAGATGEPSVQAGYLSGSLDGVAVDGAATWMSDIHTDGQSTVVLEQQTADGSVVRTRVDVDAGLAALDPGSYTLPPVDGAIRLAASTVPFEDDPGYEREPIRLEAHVAPTATARELVLIAGFPLGDELIVTIDYDVL